MLVKTVQRKWRHVNDPIDSSSLQVSFLITTRAIKVTMEIKYIYILDMYKSWLS